MSIVNSILKIFVGDKSANDIKAIQPIVNKINSYQEALKSISHDELRAKTALFKDKINSSVYCNSINAIEFNIIP